MRWGVLFHWIIWEGLRALDLGWETFSCKGQTGNVCEPPLSQLGDSVIVKQTQVKCTGMGMAVFQWNYLHKWVMGWIWLEHVCQSASPCLGSLLCNQWSTDKHPQYHLGACWKCRMHAPIRPTESESILQQLWILDSDPSLIQNCFVICFFV